LKNAKVEKLSGARFTLKDFRSTLASVTVNDDLSRLPAVSAQSRHASITTTQRSYVPMQKGIAGRQLRDAWKERPVMMHGTPFVDRSDDYTGYG